LAGDSALEAFGEQSTPLVLGAVLTLEGEVVLNEGRSTVLCTVANLSDRPIQVRTRS
jgi:hypothetical protein